MPKITVNTPVPYDVIIQPGSLDAIGSHIANLFTPCNICIVTDDNVDLHYGERVENALLSSGFQVFRFVFPAGETSKNLKTYEEILDFLAERQLTRKDLILALGGGVTGDMAGFAAATYLRGIPFIQVPTSLLAAVDSSVGGKTGVNLSTGKNLVGAFWQPSLVLFDPLTLKTLPPTQILNGIAETIKCGAIADPMLLVNLADHVLTYEDMAYECVRIKAGIVEEDERESDKRQLLNFGHTVGHAIEKCSHYTIPHGQAVAIGMLVVSKGAASLGLTSFNLVPVLKQLYEEYGVPVYCPFSAPELAEITRSDKKRFGETINIVIPDKPGRCKIVPVELDEIEKLIYMGLAF